MNTTFTKRAAHSRKHNLSSFKFFLIILLCSSFSFTPNLHGQCDGTAAIIQSGPNSLGNPALLDPNLDGFISKTGVKFSSGTTELSEFEELVGGNSCDCEVGWKKFAGSTDEPDSDTRTAGNCGNTDIVSDDDGGQDHAYYTIIDTDGDCSTTDDLNIVFRIRVADVSSGTFSFEVLVNNDELLGEFDPDGIQCCNNAINPGFEKEIQLSTGGGSAGVNVYDIDGFINGNNVMPENSYDLADNSHVAMACGTDSNCPNGAEPVFYTFFVPLDDLGFANCDLALSTLSLAAVSSPSGNPVIAECNSTSDVGGIDDNADNSVCGELDCPAGCGTCDLGEALVCAAGAFLEALPVEWLNFTVSPVDQKVNLNWATASETDNTGFEIQRSSNGSDWNNIGFERTINGNSVEIQNYAFTDERPLPGHNYYRLKQIDLNGKYDYSDVKTVLMENVMEHNLQIFPNPSNGKFTLSLHNPNGKRANIKLFDSTGSMIWEERFSKEEVQPYWEQKFDLPQHEVYFIVTQIGDQIETEKIVVIDQK